MSFDDQASATGPKTFAVQISQQPTFSTIIYDNGGASTHSGFTATPMNTLALSNSGLTGTLYFRIYGYGASSSAGTWRLDNLNVQGTIAPLQTGGGWFMDSVSIEDTACCSGP